MMLLYKLIMELCIFILVFIMMFYALQALDFSKIFRKDSTLQIKIIILFTSAAVAFAIAVGVGDILEIIGSFK